MKNYSKKSTFPLFESVCVLNGKIQHPHWHEKRFLNAYLNHFQKQPEYELFVDITYKNNPKGWEKLRIAYGEKKKQWALTPYVYKSISSLQLVEDNHIEYAHKWEDRSALNTLFLKRGNCDDILIVKNGQLTDTSYGNIAFFKNGKWFTPNQPLLEGTARARLLEEKKLNAIPISIENLFTFERFKMINAMRDFDADPSYPLTQIRPLVR